jgi:hypothetical protein
VQVDAAVGLSFHHHRVIEGDQSLALNVHQLAAHLLGLRDSGEADHYKAAHRFKDAARLAGTP